MGAEIACGELLVTDPLVPSDCDLRGLPWMPVDTVRLLDSDLWALSKPDEFKAAFKLWCKAWQQIPAASLPDDDRILAELSGMGRMWARVKPMALRGFVKCSDGRLYHPVIAEKALEAWEHREEFREKNGNATERQRRWRERQKQLSAQLRELGVTPPVGVTLKELERLLVDAAASTAPSTAASTAPSTVDAREMPLTGTGQDRTEKPTTAGKPALPEGFAEFWSTFPKRAGSNPKERAAKAWRARLADGHAVSEFIEGCARYAAFVRLTGKEGTEYVMQAATFLGPEKNFAEPWTGPNGSGEPDYSRVMREIEEEEAASAKH